MAEAETNNTDNGDQLSQRTSSSEKHKHKPGAKPRASRAGTRSVAALNSEQLARKRQNDREAQRAIRQRTKDHITYLEQRISELSAEQDDGALEELVRRNSELEEELRRLRESAYGSDDGTSPPELGRPSVVYSIESSRERQSTSYPAQWNVHNVNNPASGFLPTPVPRSQQESKWTPQMLRHLSSTSSMTIQGMSSSSQYNSDFAHMSDPPASSLAQSPVGSYKHAAPGHSASQYLQTSLPHLQEQTWQTGPPNGVRIKLERGISEGPESVNHGLPSFSSQTSLQIWERPLHLIQPTGPVDTISRNLIQTQRNLALNGVSGQDLIGPHDPEIGPLINPEAPQSAHPVSLIICGMIERIAVRGLPERLGALILLYPLYQWQIALNLETYNKMMDYYRPGPAQSTTLHPTWVTWIGWPKMREIVIANQERYATEEFQHLYNSSVNVNWPYSDADALYFEGGEARVTQAFARHAKYLYNWSLDEAFSRRYPELRDACIFTEDRIRPERAGG